jgi:hypothetical protein
MLQKSHTTSRTNKTATKYTINAHETKRAATPTHINTLPSVTAGSLSSSRSKACRFASDEACGMSLLSIS